MKRRLVYLATQSALEKFLHDRYVARVVIRRIARCEWVPLIEARTDEDRLGTFSMRFKKGREVRTWVDLRSLVEWIELRLCVEECLLISSTPEWEFDTLVLE